MSNIFFASDHHLHHSNIITFLKEDGTNLRQFPNIDEHDEHIIKMHNSVVSPKDKTYFLGDTIFSHKYLYLLGRMNGEKVLIKGNHDKLKLSQYIPYFKDIRGSHQMDGIIMSHIPVHPESLGRWPLCVHGHTHYNSVRLPNKQKDERYFCVCLEHDNIDDYTPISLEEIKSQIKNRS